MPKSSFDDEETPPAEVRDRKPAFGAKLRSFASRFMRGLAEPDGPAPPRRYWDDDFALTLSHLVRDAETKASGRVQVLSLAEFRASIGPALWNQYQSRIVIIAETTIARRMGRGNTYIAQDDESWLLLFPGLDENAAQMRADEIAAEIGEKLAGARFTMEEAPLPEAARLDLEGALNADGSLNLEVVRSAAAKAKTAQTRVSSPAKRAAMKANIAGAGAQKPAPTPTPAPKPAPTFAPSPIASATGPARPQASRIAELTIRYIPAWSADTQSIDTFYFRAFADEMNVYDPESPPMSEATILDLVTGAVEAFKVMRARNLRAKFVLPLPVSVIRTAAFSEIQKRIAALPRDERLLYLRLEYCRIASRITPEQLLALRELFRAHVREVAFPIRPFAPNEGLLALDHSVLVADVSREADRDDEQFLQTLVHLRSRVGRRTVSVIGLKTREHLQHAISAGMSEVGGTALAPELNQLPTRIKIMRP